MGHQGKQYLGSRITHSGVEFCVWAPFAKDIQVMVGEPYNWTETALTASDGYWSGIDPNAVAGQSYKYKITTQSGEVLEKNDPRARQLTVSDNGASVIIDPDFDWENTPQPVITKEGHVIYELHIGTFHRPDASTPGTFYTAIEKLDYLKELGITTIELMPVTSMAMSNGWGYAPNYLFSVENSYGGRRGLLDFVKACHERGLAVILDVVYNHFFPETDLWQFDGWHEDEQGGIYFYNDERGDTPWGGRPDYGRPEVRDFILDNVTMWLTEYHIDGLRIDSTIYMRNTEGPEGSAATAIPEAWTLLQEINQLAHKINPNVLMIAEDSSIDPALTHSIEEGGAGFDSQWGIAFPHTIRDALGLEENQYGDTIESELHHFYNEQPFQKVVFSDSHDTAANGSVRLNEAAPGSAGSVFGRQYTVIANGVTLTAPGVPMLLQGSEFLQEGSFNDWQMLEWDRTEQFKGIVLAHKHIIDLRKNTHGNAAGLQGPNIETLHNDTDNNVIAYRRWLHGGAHDEVIVIAHFNDQKLKDYYIELPEGNWHTLFNSSWPGYSKDFHETHFEPVALTKKEAVAIELSDYNLLILGRQ